MPSLSRKDRRALLICICALILFAVVQFVLFPFLDQRKRLRQGLGNKQNGLTQMREMQDGISQLSLRNNTLEQRVAERPPGFSLFAFLEKKSAEAQVKISSMKPSDPEGDGELQQVMVTMKLKAVLLDRLVDLLKRIESPENIVELQRISVQVNKKEPGTLDVTMDVVSLVQAEKNGD